MWMNVLQLVAGFAVLIVGGEALVRAAISSAEYALVRGRGTSEGSLLVAE